jgi:hypothetical protein
MSPSDLGPALVSPTALPPGAQRSGRGRCKVSTGFRRSQVSGKGGFPRPPRCVPRTHCAPSTCLAKRALIMVPFSCQRMRMRPARAFFPASLACHPPCGHQARTRQPWHLQTAIIIVALLKQGSLHLQTATVRPTPPDPTSWAPLPAFSVNWCLGKSGTSTSTGCSKAVLFMPYSASCATVPSAGLQAALV